MDREIKDSIQKFENKKEFREVKLKTSKSFREDKAALDQRLNKYRNKSISGMPAAGQTADGAGSNNGSVGDSSEPTLLESIDVELKLSLTENENSSDKSVKNEEHLNGHNGASVDLLLNKEQTPNNNGYTGQINGTNSNTNGNVPNGNAPSSNGSGQLLDGKPPAVTTPARFLNGHARGSMTPEPRLKSGKRLYEKNPKLMAASTDHLDNISLKSGHYHGNHIHMQKTIVQKPAIFNRVAPLVPAAEVARIPADGNLHAFNIEEMVTIFRLLNFSEELVSRLSRGKVDGKRFSLITDKELETLGIKNPVVIYFRDRSVLRTKRKPKFML